MYTKSYGNHVEVKLMCV